MGIFGSLFGSDDAADFAAQAAAQNRKEANAAYGVAQQNWSPYTTQGNNANNVLGNFLGLNGVGQQQQAFNNYTESPNIDFMRQQGMRAIDNSGAARGMTQSGGQLKALQSFGTGLAQQGYNSFLDRLTQQSGQGMQGANALTNARYGTANMITGANTMEGNAKANASLAEGGFLGGLFKSGIGAAATMFSDPRLKSNVVHIGKWKNGLDLYEYDIFDRREIGFMADEVKARFPEAVGERDGYMTVNYPMAMSAV